MSLITIAAALTELNDTVYPEWEALDDEFMQYYLDRASAWIQVSWQYPSSDSFDWDDDTTWPTGTASLIAQYADAIRLGLIYKTGSTGGDSTAPVKKTTIKVGPLEKTVEHAQQDVPSRRKNVVDIDDQMKALGYTRLNVKGALVRV